MLPGVLRILRSTAIPWEPGTPSLTLCQVLLYDDKHPLEMMNRTFAKFFPVPSERSKTNIGSEATILDVKTHRRLRVQASLDLTIQLWARQEWD